MTNEIYALHATIVELEMIGCWYLAEVLRRQLEILIKGGAA